MEKSSHWILTYLTILTPQPSPQRDKTNPFLEFEFVYVCHTVIFDFFMYGLIKLWKYETLQHACACFIKIFKNHNKCNKVLHVCPLHITCLISQQLSTPYLFIHNSRKYWIYYEFLLSLKLLQLIFAKNQ